MAAKRLPRLNGFWLLSVLIGVLLLVSISFYSANTDIATAEDALSTRVDYIKEQCADYSSLNLASEAKSLLRVTESAQQCARDIWYLTEKPDDLYPAAEDVLPHFVENHYLTGLLLLSRDGQITKSYCKEEALLPLLNKVLTTDSLLDVADHPKKTYAVRLVCGDDSFLDIAASAREGADCIIVAFYHTPASMSTLTNCRTSIWFPASISLRTARWPWPAAMKSLPPTMKACWGFPPTRSHRCSSSSSAASMTGWSMYVTPA